MSRWTLLFALPAFAVGAARCGLAAEFEPVETVDTANLDAAPDEWEKEQRPLTAFVNNVFWPTKETITTLRHTGNVDSEVAELLRMLRRVMREHLVPSEELVRREAVTLKELRDGSDYLLLRYPARGGFTVQIEDGNELYLLITVPEDLRKPLSEAPVFAWTTAATVVKFPDVDGHQPDPPLVVDFAKGKPKWKPTDPAAYVPQVLVKTRDIGASKCGRMHYGPWASADQDWYSDMGWWADGKRVLLAIKKIEKAEYERMARTAAVYDPRPGPRIFRSRMPKKDGN